MELEDVIDKDVYDLNGVKLGHVDLAREAEGFVLFDVRLEERARVFFDVADDVVTLSGDDVVATDFVVTLDEDAEHLLRAGLTPTSLRE